MLNNMALSKNELLVWCPPYQGSHLSLAHWMIIIQHKNPQNLSMTPKKWMIPKKMGMGMEMTLQYALIRLADQAVMIQTKPVGQTPRTITREMQG